MKIYNDEKIIGLPVNVSNLDDELMGIKISYEPKDSKDETPCGEWHISYSDAGSYIGAEGKTLEETIKKVQKKIDKLEATPFRV